MGVKKGFTPEQIIGKFRKAEVLMSKGATLADVCWKIGVPDVTFYRWRKRCGGMQVSEAKRPQTGEPIGERFIINLSTESFGMSY
jgi:putative transposase